MAFIQLTQYDDEWTQSDTANLLMRPGETGHAIYGMNGHDEIHGYNTVDHLVGGYGDDELYGHGNNDVLVGGEGHDSMYGGSGDDLLVGGQGYDVLYGGRGADRMYGGSENDEYRYQMKDGGFDWVNDNKTASGALGGGGGDKDVLFFSDIRTSEMYFYKFQDDLVVTSVFDAWDNNTINQGVIVEDFFDPHNMAASEIEIFHGWDGGTSSSSNNVTSQTLYDFFL